MSAVLPSEVAYRRRSPSDAALIPVDTQCFELQTVVHALAQVRQRWRASQQRPNEPGGRDLPSPEVVSRIVEGLRAALFPMRLGPSDLRQESEDFYVGHTLDSVLQALFEQVTLELRHGRRTAGAVDASGTRGPAQDRSARHGTQSDAPGDAHPIAQCAHALVRAFAQALPQVRTLLDSDVVAAFEGDPAAGSVDEVLLCYPGIEAMIHHRLAHRLYALGVPLLARLVAERAHARTGIDIHPGAQIGPGFFIDHGTGVVIGETAVIGRRVRIYQAVTLGAKSFPLDGDGHPVKGLARHPIVEDDVVIYAGATVLGRVTVGRGASIGGNVWVTHDVEPGARVLQASAQREAATAAPPSPSPSPSPSRAAP